jgi:hypothetical protein
MKIKLKIIISLIIPFIILFIIYFVYNPKNIIIYYECQNNKCIISKCNNKSDTNCFKNDPSCNQKCNPTKDTYYSCNGSKCDINLSCTQPNSTCFKNDPLCNNKCIYYSCKGSTQCQIDSSCTSESDKCFKNSGCLGNCKDPGSPYILNYNKNPNYLNIKSYPNITDNYFMILGDWGGPPEFTEYQYKVATAMKNYVQNEKHGKLPLFIITVGDNFYWTGLDSTDNMAKQWSNIYGDLASKVYWFPAMGNHDWGNSDPWSVCPEKKPGAVQINQQYYGCNQLNPGNPLDNINNKGGLPRPNNLNTYHFPEYSHHYEIPELFLEVIILTCDYTDCGGIGGDGGDKENCNGHKCGGWDTAQNCGNSSNMCDKLKLIGKASQNLLISRAQNTTNKNIIISQHYDGDAANVRNIFINNLPPDKKNINVFSTAGHVHDQQQPNNNVLISGGGGGCCSNYIGTTGFYIVNFDSLGNLQPKNIIVSKNYNYIYSPDNEL